jgi:hypothetical protein
MRERYIDGYAITPYDWENDEPLSDIPSRIVAFIGDEVHEARVRITSDGFGRYDTDTVVGHGRDEFDRLCNTGDESQESLDYGQWHYYVREGIAFA